MYFHTFKIRFVKTAFIFMYLVGLIYYGFLFFFFFFPTISFYVLKNTEIYIAF